MNLYDFYITPEDYEEAEAYGVSGPLLEVRIRTLGWDKDKAIQTLPHKKKPLRDWIDVAEKNGICYSTLRYRANRLGWDIERAATQPLQDRRAQAKAAYEASRKYPVKYKKMAIENGISERTFHQRLKSGWDLETAALKPVMTSREIGLATKEKQARNFKRHLPAYKRSYASR